MEQVSGHALERNWGIIYICIYILRRGKVFQLLLMQALELTYSDTCGISFKKLSITWINFITWGSRL